MKMKLRSVSRWLSFAFLVVILQACAQKPSSPSANANTTNGNSQIETVSSTQAALSCSASVPNGTTVTAGIPVNVAIVASGGLAPYEFPGDSSSSFTSSTTFARSYSNSTSNSIVIDDQITIEDSYGTQTTCTFSVTVQPESAPPSNLSCTMAASTSTVGINTPVEFLVVAAGGTGSRTFGTFNPGNNGTITVPFNPSTGTVQASYSASGQSTASIQVSDSAGNTASCSSSISVNPSPSLSVSVSPSSTQPSGSIFTLTASPANFINPPTSYTFTPSASGVTVNQSSSSSPTAQVSSTTQTSFQVTVVATNGVESASSTVTLTYTSSGQLNCSLSYPSGTYYPNNVVTFTISANTGENLVITSVQAQDGSGYYAGSNIYTQFSSAGTKQVSVYARSASTGRLCNSGAAAQTSIVISTPSNPLSCTASTNRNPTYIGQTTRATVTPSGNSGAARMTTIGISPSWAVGFYSIYANGVQADLTILTPGNFTITYNIRDAAGNTASCTSSQTVY